MATILVRSGNPFLRRAGDPVPLPDASSDEEIVAWRGWRFDWKSCTLCSLVRDTEWPRFQRLTGDRPDKDGQLGIHAWKDRSQLANLLQLDTWTIPVWGQVSLWGTVQEHDLGWRAQYAYPRGLMVLPADAHHISALSAAYGVEVTSL